MQPNDEQTPEETEAQAEAEAEKPVEEMIADLREASVEATDPAAVPPDSEPTPIPQREVGWTVIVGLENQQIKIGGTPLYTRVASVHVKASTPEKAAMEARLALTRAVEGTESDHWHALLTFIGHQEAIPT